MSLLTTGALLAGMLFLWYRSFAERMPASHLLLAFAGLLSFVALKKFGAAWLVKIYRRWRPPFPNRIQSLTEAAARGEVVFYERGESRKNFSHAGSKEGCVTENDLKRERAKIAALKVTRLPLSIASPRPPHPFPCRV